MQVTNLRTEIDGRVILNNISFILNDNDKVGLVGINGAGKSTLLKALSNKDSNSVKLNDETISYLEQEIPIKYYNYSVIDYIKEVTHIKYLEDKLHELENDLNESNMELYSDILNEFLILDGYNFEENLKSILSGLHFKNGLDSKVSELSGGEKIKVLLSILLLQNADILLLDEPTNNLDIEAIKWLENYLKNTNKKMIIVSHDEVFLDTIVNRIFELRDGNIKVYNMSYKEYLTQKEIEYNRSKLEYENAKAEKDKLKKQLVKATSWKDKGTSGKAHNDNDKLSNNYARERTNSSNVSKISKALDKVVIPKFEEKESINFFFELDDSKGNKDIILNDLVCGYDKFQTLPINLNIKYGSKIQIEGGNGSGKTTLIKTIMGIISPISGTIEMGNNVRIGYISQDTLTDNNDESIIDYITKDSSDVDYSMIFTMLDKFGISYEDKDKKYSTLSPGERTRVNLVKLALNKINVLILDEVTNHLDIDALNLIYELVSSYNGTIISISHNRKYNEILNATSVLDIEKGICCSYELAKQKRP